MFDLIIGIPTFRRPEMLEKLLLSISECNRNKHLIKSVNIVVVDNDSQRTAENTVRKFNEKGIEGLKASYHCFPEKGLANVRNEMLRQSLKIKSDFIVFVDDDEFVTSHWLDGHLKTILQYNADAVRGPVLAVLNSGVKKEIVQLFKREKYPEGTRLYRWTTGNLMLRTSTLLKNKIWFDPRFNETGSEDYYFGVQMQKYGASLYWAADAVTYENIPDLRATIKWVIKRRFRMPFMYSRVQVIEGNYFKVFKKMVVSFTNILMGLAASVLLIFPGKFRYWGLLKIVEGTGGIMGIFKKSFKEYKSGHHHSLILHES
ncbi:MAG: glycosyltransferase [Chitinophagaceae bacterium]|nr:glycosyltransferase [Chitinophagaceae bacterium]